MAHAPVRRLRRSPTNRVLGGVCGGVAEMIGVEAVVVRLAFAVLAVAGGWGVVLYLVLWAALPSQDGGAPLVHRQWREDDVKRAGSLGLVVLGFLLLLRRLGFGFDDSVVWPVALAAAGGAVLWLHGDDEERGLLGRLVARVPADGGRSLTRLLPIVRLAAGAALVSLGVVLFVSESAGFAAARQAFLATAGIVGGVLLVGGPLLLRLGRDLTQERRERIRAAERADVAAHLHDSVLQTLALIQRSASDERQVVSLARKQERELREWLYGSRRGDVGHGDDSFATCLARACAEVEELHGVRVEVVTVGDCAMDAAADAIVRAAREAATNAAKWSGVDDVAVYAEVEGDEIVVFVRDRGKGFDPATVATDRQGIASSIVGRVERHGGRADVRSAVGEGTEVELRVPREDR